MFFKNPRMVAVATFLAGLFPHSQSAPVAKRKPVGNAAKSPELQFELSWKAEDKRERRRARNLRNLQFTKRYAHQ